MIRSTLAFLPACILLPAAVMAQDAPAPPPLDFADTLNAIEASDAERPPAFVDRAEVGRIVAEAYPAGLLEARIGGTVMVRLVVDAHGRALAPRVAESSGNPGFDRAAQDAVEEIRFVPAVHGGAPRPVWVNLPVVFTAPDLDWVPGVPPEQVRAWADSAGALAPSEVDERPVVRDPQEAMKILADAYPRSLNGTGTAGMTSVWFVVTPAGSPSAGRVAHSSGSEELDRSALRVVGRLRFRPALRGGSPVAAWTTFPVEFLPPPTPQREHPASDSLGAYEMSEVERLPELKNRPEVGREISRVYPAALLERGVSGSVTLRFLVDTLGVPDEVQVEHATHPDFTAAAIRVVTVMRFAPARVGGKAVRVWVMLPLQFQSPPPDLTPPSQRRPQPGQRPDPWGESWP